MALIVNGTTIPEVWGNLKIPAKKNAFFSFPFKVVANSKNVWECVEEYVPSKVTWNTAYLTEDQWLDFNGAIYISYGGDEKHIKQLFKDNAVLCTDGKYYKRGKFIKEVGGIKIYAALGSKIIDWLDPEYKRGHTYWGVTSAKLEVKYHDTVVFTSAKNLDTTIITGTDGKKYRRNLLHETASHGDKYYDVEAHK